MLKLPSDKAYPLKLTQIYKQYLFQVVNFVMRNEIMSGTFNDSSVYANVLYVKVCLVF